MLENLKFTINLVLGAIRKHELSTLLHHQVFCKRIAVPIVIDLSKLDVSQDPLQNLNYRLIELKKDDIESRAFTFLVELRRLDALRNLKRGLRGFALVTAENIVIGDIWCKTPNDPRTPIKHPDLKMLKITCSETDTYALDMFIPTDYRGKKLAVPLHRALQRTLRQEGWQKLYAYYWEDNISSKWMHWMLKCTELPKIRISRFFFLIKAHTAS